MNRTSRMELAAETVAIVERGAYVSARGLAVDISQSVSDCLAATRLHPADGMEAAMADALALPLTHAAAAIEVANETTLAALARLAADARGPVGVLNFASAKNPGGGFLNGSQAQEESLARSSALHASLMGAWDFYARHRASPSLLYSDAMIVSPQCPVFRDDDGTLLDAPRLTTFITSPGRMPAPARTCGRTNCRTSRRCCCVAPATCSRWPRCTAAGISCLAPGAAACSATIRRSSPAHSRAICAMPDGGGSSVASCSRCSTRRTRTRRSTRSNVRSQPAIDTLLRPAEHRPRPPGRAP